jgi:membrane associated rhomboid family serine protease
MGIYDREYIQPEPQRGFGSTVADWPWAYRLIAFTAAVFVLDSLTEFKLTEWGCFETGAAVFGLQIWRFFTFQFLHANLGHLFFNMLALFFFGRFVEGELGRRPFLAFYLICGTTGSVAYALLNLVGFLPSGQLVGASAGVLGVVVACAVVAPNMTVLLMFVFPMQIRVLAILAVGLAALVLITGGENAGGEAAHLGGALVGFLLIRNRGWLAWADASPRARRPARPPWRLPNLTRLLPDRSVSDEELDRLLDKVREQGLDSLTSREKSTLKRASKERRDRQRRL